ncbi:Hypothetical predicted protein [Xyrichtys novacula]|uniref:PiggyBac transposable element-derived protein domain-containing protein n=1 Tax=Xyrichtys novacula TaxID=13765 RepID=A0AAV1F1C2_XYRNO|nr:Hypothetical predicted protein [Xyrichtys novacula]
MEVSTKRDNLFADNLFASVPLVLNLLQQKIYVIGTLVVNLRMRKVLLREAEDPLMPGWRRWPLSSRKISHSECWKKTVGHYKTHHTSTGPKIN